MVKLEKPLVSRLAVVGGSAERDAQFRKVRPQAFGNIPGRPLPGGGLA
jgi:hypothetical protein